MKHNNFPRSEEEWNRIYTDAFSENAEPHIFSKVYQSQKQKMEEQLMPKRHLHWKRTLIAAAAVAATIALVPSTVLAVSHITAYVRDTGAYQKDVVISAENNTSAQPMALSFGWLPDGMTETDGKYYDAQDRGISPVFWKLTDSNHIMEYSIQYAISHEQYDYNDKTVLYVQKDTTGKSGAVYDRELLIAFQDTPYVAQLYITDNVTEEEWKKIAENLTLTPSDKETAQEWTEPEAIMENADAPVQLDTSRLQVCQIGDIVSDTVFDGNTTVSVNSASLQNNFDGLTTDGIGMTADYSAYQNVDGSIADNIRTWYSCGDGVDTLNKQIEQETIPQRVLVLHLTYTNTGSEAEEVCVSPYLFCLENDTAFSDPDALYNDIYHEDSCGELKYDGMAFSFATNHSYQKNNLTALQPGESADVTLAFLIDEDALDNLYLNLIPSSRELTEELNLGLPAVDLRNLK